MSVLNLLSPENTIKIGEQVIRYFYYKDQYLFVAKDLGDCLGYPVPDVALRKTVSKFNLIPAHFKSSTQGRGQNLITPTGVIELLSKSKMPKADVLRKTLEGLGLIRLDSSSLEETVKLLKTSVGRVRATESKPLFFAKDVMSAYGLPASQFKKIFKDIIRLNCGEAKLTMLADEHALRALVAYSDRANANIIPEILLSAWEQTVVASSGLDLDSIRVYRIPNSILSMDFATDSAGLSKDSASAESSTLRAINALVTNALATDSANAESSTLRATDGLVTDSTTNASDEDTSTDNMSTRTRCSYSKASQQSKQGDCLAVPSCAPNIWFVGRDVAAVIGYVDTKSAVKDNVSSSNKIKVVIPTDNGKKSVNVINLNGVKELAYKSRTSKAFQFRRILEADSWHPSPIGDVISIIYTSNGYVKKDVLESSAGSLILSQANNESAPQTQTSIGDFATQLSENNGVPMGHQTAQDGSVISTDIGSATQTQTATADMSGFATQTAQTAQIVRTSIKLTDCLETTALVPSEHSIQIDTKIIDTPLGPVRYVVIGDTNWYVLKDICNVIEIVNYKSVAHKITTTPPVFLFDQLNSSNPRFDSATIKESTYLKLPRSLVSKQYKSISQKGMEGEEVIIVNTPCLFDILFSSKKPKAKQFRDFFLTQLPVIRVENPTSDIVNKISILSDQIKRLTELQAQLLNLSNLQTNQSLNEIQQTLEDSTIQVTRLISTVSTTALAFRFNFKVPQLYKYLIYKGLVYKDEAINSYMPTTLAIRMGLAVIKSSAHKPYVHWLIEPMQEYISQQMSDIGRFNLEWLEANKGKSPY